MSAEQLTARLVALAATIFIAVLVWRVGALWVFNDRSGRENSPTASGANADAGDGSANSSGVVIVRQAGNNSIELAAGSAMLNSPSLALHDDGTPAIGGWRASHDSCSWTVAVDQPGDGYFRASIRYRTVQPVRFELSNGERPLTVWTLYPTDSIAVDEKFARIPNPGQYRLTARPLGAAPSLKVYGITLAPR
jgi:hypothetical protein